MKKTLIALLALAGVAAADYDTTQLWSVDMSQNAYTPTNQKATFDYKTQWSSTDFTTLPGYVSNASDKISMEEGTAAGGLLLDSSFILTMDCKLSSVQNANGTNTLIDVEKNASNHFYVYYDNSSSAVTLGSVGFSLSNSSSEGTFTLTDITSVTLCYENKGAGAGLSVYVGTENGYTLAATADVTSLPNSNGDYGFVKSIGLLNKMENSNKVIGGVSSVSAYSVVSSPNVPEPATATLSLLALAGLSARRRRK